MDKETIKRLREEFEGFQDEMEIKIKEYFHNEIGDTEYYNYIVGKRDAFKTIVKYLKKKEDNEDINGNECDLIRIKDKKEGWINIYECWDDRTVNGIIGNTRKEAMEDAKHYIPKRIDTIKIEWEEWL